MRAGFVALALCLSGLCLAQDRFPDVPERYERMAGQFTIDAMIRDLTRVGVIVPPS